MTSRSTDAEREEFDDSEEMESGGPSPEMRAIYEESLRDVIEGTLSRAPSWKCARTSSSSTSDTNPKG
jgi:hypothetical protein